jgi:hypothetical protein
MLKRIIAVLLLLATPAAAQTPPYVYAITMGTTQTQVLPSNTGRKRVVFINPNAVALVAVCPAGPTRTGTSVVAKINGPGCHTLLPYGELAVDAGIATGALLNMPTAWIAIADTPSSALTIWEFE